MRLIVATKSKAAIAYQAVYSDNKSGARPPFGAGYGGNDKGFASDEGSYASTWLVSPKAPPGPARVDVVVSWGDGWGYDGPTFTVAGGGGGC